MKTDRIMSGDKCPGDLNQEFKMTSKSQLRVYMAKVLAGLSEKDKRQQSEVVFRRLLEHPKYKSAKSLSIYLSTKNEIDTVKILKHSLEVEQKICFIPLVRKQRDQLGFDDGTRMLMVRLNSMSEYDELPMNNYGIKEFCRESISGLGKAKANELDLHVVPGLAFAKDGRRLGHGKGYYDEYLNSSSNSKLGYMLGLAFEQQLVEDLEAVAGHDVMLDEVLVGGE